MARRKPDNQDSANPAADPTTDYARSVVEGREPAGRLVGLACERHIRDLEEGQSRGLHWDTEAANRVLKFFSMLRLPGSDGSESMPFKLHPSQEFIVGSLFGWKSEDGYRRFRTAYVEKGKGNGKSPLAGGIGVYMTIADREAAAEVYSAATTREQAGILFRDAKMIVEASETLQKHLTVDKFNIAHQRSNSFFRPVSSEHRGLDGKRPHCALIDEIHEHPSDLVVDKMRAGTKGRRQALIFEITNSGYDRHSVCWRHHEYSEKVLEGAIPNDTWFAYVCTMDPCEKHRAEGKRQPVDGCPDCDDWRNPKVWRKANPCLGVTLTEKYLREQVVEAEGMPAKANIVKRLNFCLWTEQAERWLDLATWNRCGDRFDPASLLGRECYGGLDLARVSDLTALALLFPPLSDDLWWLLTWHWCPQEDIRERSYKDRVPYDLWAQQGLIRPTPGNTTDYSMVRRDIGDIGTKYRIREIAFDRTFAGEIVQGLQDDGFEMVAFGQGFLSMGAPTAEFERLLKAGVLRHGGNPLLRWQASNVAAAQDAAGNLKPDKEKSGEKIDGIVASIMALGRAVVRTPGDENWYKPGCLLA